MRKITLLILTLGIVVMGAGYEAYAQGDADGCKDHPLISRMKNYYINSCEKNFNSFEFFIKDGQSKPLEGERTKISYTVKDGSPQPSFLHIRRNYQAAVKNVGGTVLYDDDRRGTFRIASEGKEAWIALEAFNEGRNYELVIVEMGGMEQEVTAGARGNALNRAGSEQMLQTKPTPPSAPATQTPSAGNDAVTGGVTIMVADGSGPVSGANVTVAIPPHGTWLVYSDSAGKAVFGYLQPGAHRFWATKADSRGSVDVTVTSGAMASGTIMLAKLSTKVPGPAVAPATSAGALTTTGSAAITVNEGVNPVSGVPVSVTVKGVLQTVKTNATGRADFTDLPIGAYTFMADATSSYTAATTNVTVSMGSTATGTITVTRPPGSAAIHVKWGPPDNQSWNEKLSGATVNVTVNGTARTAATDAQGNATLDNLPQGTYDFAGSKSGFSSNSTRVTVTAGQQTAGEIRLNLLGNATTITVTNGSVPIGSANVVADAINDPNHHLVQGQTDATGKVTFNNLWPADYHVYVEKTGYYADSITVPGVSTGQKTGTIILKQPGTAVIIVTDGINPISGADVSGKTTDAIGRVTLSNESPGLRYYSTYKVGYDNTGAAISLVIPSGGTVTGTIILKKR